MITNERSSYLSERVYQHNGNIDKDCFAFWVELLGPEKVEYLRQLYPERVGAYLCGSSFSTTNDTISNIESPFSHTGESCRELLPEAIVFKEFYLPFLEAAYTTLVSRTGKELEPAVRTSFFKSLLKKLEDICMRILITEMHSCRDEELLTDGGPREQYDYYVREFLGDISYIRELCEQYPVMLRRIAESMEHFIRLNAMILLGFERDQQRIQQVFFDGRNPGGITDLELNISDSHNQGKMVCVLHFTSGEKLVFKPRSLQNEKSYQQIARYISEGCGVEQYDYQILDQGDHSWMEYIEYRSCTTSGELSGYYERLGVHLFINHLLCGGDLHYENLIAMGAYPVLLDMEVMLEARSGAVAKDAAESVLLKLQDSVLYRGILPFSLWNQDGTGVNVSIMEGSGGQQVPFKIPVVIDPFTSNMRVEYASPVMEYSKNLPLLNGTFTGARQFTLDLKQGFQKAYNYFLSHTEAVIGKLDELAGVKKRVLIRNTQEYSMYLTLSYHPRFLSDGADREMILYSLFNGQETMREQWLAESEIRDILNGDIPYFYQYADDTAVYNSSGQCLKDYYPKTALQLIKERALGLNREDYEQQSRFIDLSMNLLSSERQENESTGKPLLSEEQLSGSAVGREVIEECVTAIADDILQAAIYADDRTDVNWIGMSLMETAKTSWQIEPMNNRLYDGLAGLAVFFHAVYHYTRCEKYQEVCSVLDKSLFTYTDKVLNSVPQVSSTGIFTGESSLIYTYQLLYSITGQKQYLDYAGKHCRIIEGMLAGDSCFDLLSGNAGAALALTNMFELTKDGHYLNLAANAAEVLLSRVIAAKDGAAWPPLFGEIPLLGFSHGTSGIVYALAKLYEYRRDERIPQVIRGALIYEDSYFDSKRHNWPDLRKPESAGGSAYMVAWCHGAAGILLSREGLLEMFVGIEGEKIKMAIQLAEGAIADSSQMENYCLCHGNIGNTAILEQSVRKQEDHHTIRQCTGYYEWFASSYLADQIHFSMQEENNYGFMSGLSGIGYYLLRSICQELPDVLKLEIKRQN